jgi:hypothetical protein
VADVNLSHQVDMIFNPAQAAATPLSSVFLLIFSNGIPEGVILVIFMVFAITFLKEKLAGLQGTGTGCLNEP